MPCETVFLRLSWDTARPVKCLNESFLHASYLAAMSLHSGDWLLALPMTSFGSKLDDEAVKVVTGFAPRPEVNLCIPH